MIGDLFAPVEQLARAGGVWSYAAAVVLGFLAIWLSPCHLVGLTLASTYLRRRAGGPRQVALGLSAFLVAMLATAALVAAATLALGSRPHVDSRRIWIRRDSPVEIHCVLVVALSLRERWAEARFHQTT